MPRVLFVEDDPEIGQLISSWLGRHDIEVLLETRGDRALDRALAEQPDLVLLDIMLPGQDGLSLCRDLRPRFAGPIVMLTSLDSDMNQILSLELGANDYILKTTPPPVLLARLRVGGSPLPREASPAASPPLAHSTAKSYYAPLGEGAKRF